MIVLINDILDLAKVDAGKMTFEQTAFNLSKSISTMLQLFEPKIKEKNLVLIHNYDNTIPQQIIGDPMRLRQIILNLLSNAVKFTKQGSITMGVRRLEEDADKVRIEFTFTDTGIGIHKDKLGQIFNNFEQASKETSNSFGGTGLGLAIAKQLVELQDGTIHVTSEVGKGSTFYFTLFFRKSVTRKETEPIKGIQSSSATTKEEIKKIKVLVAEDVPLNQLLIKIIIAEFGFDLDIADNGKVAIDMIQKNKYDIILMDLQMPEMNGFDATSYIREKMHSQIPIIALTADVTTVDVEKCKTVGMNDYISKPIDEKLLYIKIMKSLKKPEKKKILV